MSNETMDDDERLARQLQEMDMEEQIRAANARAAEEESTAKLIKQLQELEERELQQTRQSSMNLQVGGTTLVRLCHQVTGNYIKEVLSVRNLANNVVVFEVAENNLGLKLIVGDNGRVNFERDHSDRSKFIVELNGNDGNVCLLNKAQRYRTNALGSQGWYLSMSPGGQLLGDSGRTAAAVWTLVGTQTSATDTVQNALPAAPSAQQPQPQPQRPTNSASSRTSPPAPPIRGFAKYDAGTNPIIIWLHSQDGLDYVRANSALHEMFQNECGGNSNSSSNSNSAGGEDDHGAINYNRALQHYIIYRPDGWEGCAVRLYNYTQRQQSYFPRGLGTMSVPFSSYYDSQQFKLLSGSQLEEFDQCGYLVVPGLCDVQFGETNAVKSVLKLIRYFEGFHTKRGLLHDNYELLCPSVANATGCAGDADVLALYYDTPLFALCYQLLERAQYLPPEEPADTAEEDDADGPGAGSISGDYGLVSTHESNMVEMADYTKNTSANPMLTGYDGLSASSAAMGGKRPVIRQYINHSSIEASYPCYSSGSGPGSTANSWELVADSVVNTHAAPLSGEDARWRVTSGGRGPAADKKVQTTGLRIVVALSDTTANHPDMGTVRPLESVGNLCLYEGSHTTLQEVLNPSSASAVANKINFPKDNASFVDEAFTANKPVLGRMKQLYLSPGDVVICNENLAFKSQGLPNFADDIKYNLCFHVCHQY